jgi:hypothetical protein
MPQMPRPQFALEETRNSALKFSILILFFFLGFLPSQA